MVRASERPIDKMKPFSFRIRYITNQGEVGVLINDIRYTYHLDAGFIPKIERMARHRPGKALNFLKKVARECVKEERLWKRRRNA